MTTQMQPAVVCRDITKDFGSGDSRLQVLRGVDFEAQYGEMTLLVGPSGCGKTTLLSVIAGLLNKSGGQIDVLGTEVDKLSGSESVLFRPAIFRPTCRR